LLGPVLFLYSAEGKGAAPGPHFSKGFKMNKKPKKLKMFVMKETLIDLTPHLLGEAQGADCGLCTAGTNFQLSDVGSCNPCLVDKQTRLRTINPN
jgi:hypothetical protein